MGDTTEDESFGVKLQRNRTVTTGGFWRADKLHKVLNEIVTPSLLILVGDYFYVSLLEIFVVIWCLLNYGRSQLSYL